MPIVKLIPAHLAINEAGEAEYFVDASGQNIIPLAGSVAAEDITDSTAVGRALLTAASQIAARSAIGAQGTVGTPSAFTSRDLAAADDGATLVCATAQTVTVNTGLTGFNSCLFDGPISFSGTATVTDSRTSGATTIVCALIRIGTDAYRAVGGKA